MSSTPMALTPVGARRLRRLWLVAALGVAATLLMGSGVAQASVVVAGSSWLGGRGVDVCVPLYDGCGGNATTTGSGSGFQCVDLPQRLYKKLGWYGANQFAGVRNAYQIYDLASSLGFSRQANGSIASIVPGDMIIEDPTGGNQGAGHVAVVESVSGGTVSVLEQHASATGRNTYRLSGGTLVGNYAPVRGVVHAPANTLSNSGRASNGSLIQTPDGHVYRVAGGAPLYVSGCGAITGGCEGVIPASNLDAYASRPANGTKLSAADGRVWIVAGGAPILVSSCDAIGGCDGAVQIDPYAVDHLDHLNPSPSNGTLLRDNATGRIWAVAGGAPLLVAGCAAVVSCDGYVAVDPSAITNLDHLASAPMDRTLLVDSAAKVWIVAGGAPIAVGSCDAIGGCDGATRIDDYALTHNDHLTSVPNDGTLLRALSNGQVWVVAGGAPLAVASCDAVNECAGYINVDPASVDALDHLLAVPNDGTILRDGASGHVWTVGGGAALNVDSCSAILSCNGFVTIDGYAVGHNDHLRGSPLDGTFLHDAGGQQYRLAGGAALRVSNCDPLGGCIPSAIADIAGSGLAGSAPVNGTVLIGEPSGQRWAITDGKRTAATSGPGGVTINDDVIATIPPAQDESGGGPRTPQPPNTNPGPGRAPVPGRPALANQATIKRALSRLLGDIVSALGHRGHSRRLTVRFAWPRAGSITIRITTPSGRTVLGSGTSNAGAPGTRSVMVRLSEAGEHLLQSRSTKGHHLRLVATFTTTSHQKVTTSRNAVTPRRPPA